MGKLLTSHRSTIYPCYLPILGESTGAGRIRLTRHKGIKEIVGKFACLRLKSFTGKNLFLTNFHTLQLCNISTFLMAFSYICQIKPTTMNIHKHSITYALATGIVVIVFSLCIYLAGLTNPAWNYLSYIFYIGLLVYALKNWRDKEKKGILSYGQAMGYSTVFALYYICLLYTSDAADDLLCVDL